MRGIVEGYLSNNRYWRATSGSYDGCTGKAWMDVARAPSKTHPLMRGLAIPALRDRQQIRITVVVEDYHSTECVDDVNSTHYNKVVDRMKVGNFDWKSSEKMLAVGAEYDLGVFVAHNSYPVRRGDGSCIFLHVWKDAASPTSGCTAMERTKLERLLTWVEPKSNPYLVQLPEKEYKNLTRAWGLPKL